MGDDNLRNISILGVTGSIGTQTLDVIRESSGQIKLVGISANTNIDKIIEVIKEFKPKYVAMRDVDAADKLNKICNELKIKIHVYGGLEGLVKIATLDEIDLVVTSVVGMIGLKPTIEAIRCKKDIALANKETLVVAGKFVMEEARLNGISILPVDSEHGAIFQSLQGNQRNSLKNILLTASGGPFRGKTYEEVRKATLQQALKHPKWNMGKKISIDSATLMNKGLEVIEAHYLFDVPYENIKVIIHPESVIHSMVEYIDGSVIAQMAVPDMRLPIQYALNYPNRKPTIVNELDFYEMSALHFERPNMDSFKCLKLAYKAGKLGGNMPVILNAANEVAVNSFINGEITFGEIGDLVEDAMNNFKYRQYISLEDIYSIDSTVRDYVYKNIRSER